MAGVVLAFITVGSLFYFLSSKPEPLPSKKITKPIPVKAKPPQVASPVQQPMTEQEALELELLLSDGSQRQVEETLIIDGIPLIRVIGDQVTKDPVTGVLTITGVTKLLLLDGSHVEMSSDGYVTHDPATGKTEAKAAHTKFIPVTKPDEK